MPASTARASLNGRPPLRPCCAVVMSGATLNHSDLGDAVGLHVHEHDRGDHRGPPKTVRRVAASLAATQWPASRALLRLTGVRYRQRSSDWPPVRGGRPASRAPPGPRRGPPMLSISRPRPAQVAAAISGAALTAALVIAPGGSPGALAAAGAAPGAPGTASDWVPGDKDGFGTAHGTASKVWYTLSRGTLNEVFYPQIDTPS